MGSEPRPLCSLPFPSHGPQRREGRGPSPGHTIVSDLVSVLGG